MDEDQMKTTFIVRDEGEETHRIVKLDSLTKKEGETFGNLIMQNAFSQGLWNGNSYYPPSSIIKVIVEHKKK